MAGVVGTLNMMGESYNFLEFADDNKRNQDQDEQESWIQRYGRILERFKILKSADVVREAEAIGFKLQVALHNELFFQECTEEFLQRDNKMALTNRTNLIVCGAKPVHGDGTPLFLHAKNWRALMKDQVVHYHENLKDHCMALWDVACNLAAEGCHGDYLSLGRESYLNPDNFVVRLNMIYVLAEGWFRLTSVLVRIIIKFCPGSAGQHESLVSWMALQTVLEERGYHVYEVVSATDDPRDAEEAAGRSHAAKIGSDSVQQRGRRWWWRRVCSCVSFAEETLDIGDKLRVINVHVKVSWEADDCLCHEFNPVVFDISNKERINFLLADTNIPNSSKVETFSARAAALGLRVFPSGVTTRKKRTELHGQMYDARKCLKVVEARKDFCLCWAASELREQLESSQSSWQVKVSPELGEDGEMLLPNAHWPTDHAMLSVQVELLPQLLSSV
ncbi:hypothetical protein GUITHDRAFT_110918 [Guillardia theta CCMP2712]|uniref:Uncharacterized protein n=1 Tax=Guillardia theta (strain CCMP2712) TaxID=905079 RepID=L1J4D8_GUITC|nr:hypothetical protein GUITHDRAFT_110918 [Guillardia theta CCMP2712]EKX43192.1 hypothetical protein GUITHDRAFT_110918 [Guillardia theta CCMP2712]|eukprot:XP_005830172.1 hypothetical protein GUITHDRAFT_110918 [Guillardia theta CCMP2712]